MLDRAAITCRLEKCPLERNIFGKEEDSVSELKFMDIELGG